MFAACSLSLEDVFDFGANKLGIKDFKEQHKIA